jgi:hypothetical protein
MTFHETVTQEYATELHNRFLTQAEWAKAAPDWRETQRRIIGGVRPYVVAIERADAGWTKEEIERELSVRVTMAHLGVPLNVE